jgi:DNA-binding transcriptional MerR regulator
MLNNTIIPFELASPGGLHVAELADEAGLLHDERDPNNGYRYFSPADLERVRFIRQAQDLGLKIADIESIFESVEKGNVPCGKVESLVRRRLDDICRQIEELKSIKSRIAAAIPEWEEGGDRMEQTARFCPLIEQFGYRTK